MKVKDMLLVAHSISDKVYTTTPFANIESVSKTLTDKGVGALPVVRDGKLVGIISERDIVTKVVAKRLSPQHTTVMEVMTPNPSVVFLSYDLEECLDMMERGKFRHLPVIDNYKLIGMISIRDILVALVKEKENLAEHFQRFIVANR